MAFMIGRQAPTRSPPPTNPLRWRCTFQPSRYPAVDRPHILFLIFFQMALSGGAAMESKISQLAPSAVAYMQSLRKVSTSAI